MGVKQLSLKRPTVEGFHLLNEDEQLFFNDIATESLRENDTLRVNGKDRKPKHETLMEFSYRDVMKVRKLLLDLDIFQILKTIYGVTKNEFRKLDFLNSMACYSWVVSETQIIQRAEENKLSGELTVKEKNAGFEQIAEEYEDYPMIRSYAMNWRLSIEQTKNLPYGIIFLDVAYTTDEAKSFKNLNKSK